MKVILLRSDDFNEGAFEGTLTLLQKYQGVIKFSGAEEDDLQAHFAPEVSTWEQLFHRCELFRSNEEVDSDTHIVLLSNVANERNWFSASDPKANNHYVHTANWEAYWGNDLDIRFPIAYEVVLNLLLKESFTDYEDLTPHLHQNPKGCALDFCQDKDEIILKMRTADICDECFNEFKERKVDRRLMRQVLEIMDGIRQSMTFRSRASFLKDPSQLEIRGPLRKVYFTDLGDLPLRLNPKEKALFHLFLAHEEGIELSELHKHKEEISKLYRRFSDLDDPAEVENAIERIIHPTDNNKYEVLSRLNKKIKKAVGPDLAEHYLVKGGHQSVRKIALDRKLVKNYN